MHILRAGLVLFVFGVASSMAHADDHQITIVLTGDTGFSRNHSLVHTKGVLMHGKRPPFRAALAGIRGRIVSSCAR